MNTSHEWINMAEHMIDECNGTHPVEEIQAKSQVAIADALVAIAKDLHELNTLMFKYTAVSLDEVEK